MKLTIHNLAKIESADVDLNGITLIAGANDTGKSTCGKALCALLTVFRDLPDGVKRIRTSHLLDVFNIPPHRQFMLRDDNVIDKYLNGEIGVDEFCRKMLATFPSGLREKSTNKEDVKNDAEEVRLLSEDAIKKEAILRVFTSVFNGQYRPLTRNKDDGKRRQPTTIELISSSLSLSVSLETKLCSFSQQGETSARAWYLSNPKLVDLLESHYWGSQDWFDRKLISAIHEAVDSASADPVNGAFDAAMMKKKIAALESCFSKINDDKVVYDKEKGFSIRRKSLSTPMNLMNASMGLKGIVLLKIMIENGVFRPGDFLVLDEPEIHLHPEWQLYYAELVVLLRKEFGITILLTTHSPDFIQAIHVFSKKHGIADDVTAYLTEGKERTTLKPVGNDGWDELFERFVPTIKLLEKLSEETEA